MSEVPLYQVRALDAEAASEQPYPITTLQPVPSPLLLYAFLLSYLRYFFSLLYSRCRSYKVLEP